MNRLLGVFLVKTEHGSRRYLPYASIPQQSIHLSTYLDVMVLVEVIEDRWF